MILLDNYFLKFSLVHKMAYSLEMVKSINISYILQRALHFVCELVHNISIDFKMDIQQLSIYRYLVPQSIEHIDYSMRWKYLPDAFGLLWPQVPKGFTIGRSALFVSNNEDDNSGISSVAESLSITRESIRNPFEYSVCSIICGSSSFQ